MSGSNLYCSRKVDLQTEPAIPTFDEGVLGGVGAFPFFPAKTKVLGCIVDTSPVLIWCLCQHQQLLKYDMKQTLSMTTAFTLPPSFSSFVSSSSTSDSPSTSS